MKAFPNGELNPYGKLVNDGMDLRDYFAARAMQVLLAEKDDAGTVLWEPTGAAEYSYEVADAMMKAREIK